ncbi:MAG TPA: hypothetical protein VHD15_05510 [Hyphomicrobiales bacterium]|nr:hypothetical protein [Hyphomicrobiales bacterium]
MKTTLASRILAAAVLTAAMAAAAPALARKHPSQPTILEPDLETLPYGLNPPPQTLYPQPRSTATQPLPRVHSQVPVGRAQPGVTPYELLPNHP